MPKKPWEMTRDEFIIRGLAKDEAVKRNVGQTLGLPMARQHWAAQHGTLVKDALREGKPVPAEVLKDYPDLKRQAEVEAKKQFERKWQKAYGSQPETIDTKKPVSLNWDKLHFQSKEELLIGAGMNKKLAAKKWDDIDTWEQNLIKDSLERRSKGKAELKPVPPEPKAEKRESVTPEEVAEVRLQKSWGEMLLDKRITELYPELEELSSKRSVAIDRMGEIQEAGGSGARYSAIRDRVEADLASLQMKIFKEHPELAYADVKPQFPVEPKPSGAKVPAKPRAEKPPRLTVRAKTYRGEAGYTVKGEDTDIFFSKESQAREYVKRVKAGEKPDKVLSDIWGIKQVRSGYTVVDLIRIHAKRSPLSRASDERQEHQVTISPDSPRVKSWIKDPGTADISGVDTPRLGRKSPRITPKTPRLRR